MVENNTSELGGRSVDSPRGAALAPGGCCSATGGRSASRNGRDTVTGLFLSAAAFLILLALMLFAVPGNALAAVTTGTCGTDCVYEYDKSAHALTISVAEDKESGTFGWPSDINDYRSWIKSIKVCYGVKAPENCSWLFATFPDLVSLDLSGFDTSKVTNMQFMFYNCESLNTIDLSGFDISSVTEIDKMFAYCGSLTTIYSDHDWQCPAGSEVFIECYSLVGGNGTTFDSPSGGNAVIDRLGSSGYFTGSCTHDIVDVSATVPTCVKAGSTAGKKCSKCGKVLSGCKQIAALGHEWGAGVVTAAATCTEPGTTTYTCTREGCGQTKTETIAALNHDFGEYVSNGDATCTTDGTKTATCSRCDATDTVADVGSALGHSPEEVAAVAATCTEPGKTAGSRCSRCGETLVAQEEVAALGHSPEEVAAVAATCTEPGKTVGSRCSRCGETLVAQEEVAALGHDYDATIKKATCTEGGSTTHTCSRCGDSYTDSKTAALGHEWGAGEVTAAATCTEPGTMTYACARGGCGQTKTEPIAALGHKLTKTEAKAATAIEAGNKEYWTCSACKKLFADAEGTTETTLADVAIPATGSVTAGGVTYSIEGGAASVESIPATAKSAVIAATVKDGGKSYKVTAVTKSALKQAKRLQKLTLGKNVASVQSGAFKACKSLKTLVVTGKKLTKSSVKGMLKGSSVKTVKVKVSGGKKVNKKYAAKYKKLFTKKICGKKVTVK